MRSLRDHKALHEKVQREKQGGTRHEQPAVKKSAVSPQPAAKKLSLRDRFRRRTGLDQGCRPTVEDVSAQMPENLPGSVQTSLDEEERGPVTREEDLALRKELDSILKNRRHSDYEVPELTRKIKGSRKLKAVLEFILPILLIYVVFFKIILIGAVPSASMEPTLRRSDIIVANRIAYTAGTPERGDIVVFKKNRSYLIKRVIGLPGEHIELVGGSVSVNGKILREHYLEDMTITLPFLDGNQLTSFDVPADSYLLLGDNRPGSGDSRYWTKSDGSADPYVKADDIVGRAFIFLRLKKGIALKALRKVDYIQTTDYDGTVFVPDEHAYFLDEEGYKKKLEEQEKEPADPDKVIMETLPVESIQKQMETEMEGVANQQDDGETLPVN